MKSASAALDLHLQQEVTSISTCWKVKRTDGVTFHFTDHDVSLPVDIGDGDGETLYIPSTSYNRSAIKNTDTLSVDNLDLTGVLADDTIDETELKRGLFDFASVRIFAVNWEDLSQGILRLRKGWLGEVSVTPNGFFVSELRGLMQVFSRKKAEKISPECRTDLGSDECKVPILPDEVQRSTTYNVGDFIRASNDKFIPLAVTNPGAELGVTGWTNEIGTLDATDAQVTPHSGSAYFSGGDAELETKAFQDIVVPALEETEVDAGNRSVRVTWYEQSLEDDQTEMTVRFFDVSLVQIGVEVSAGLVSNIGSWAQRQILTEVPADTRTIRIAMHMVGNTGPDTDGFIDDITLDLVKNNPLSEDFHDRIFRCIVAGTTAEVQPVYDTDIGDPTVDGTATFEAEEAWSRMIEVVAVDMGDPRKIFTVTELTPNSGGITPGRDFFPNSAIDGGMVSWETGDNAGRAMEVRGFNADDGMTIEQQIELFLPMIFDIQVGDKARIYRGCFKRMLEDCVAIFDNAVNQRAEAYLPGQDFLFNYPDSSS